MLRPRNRRRRCAAIIATLAVAGATLTACSGDDLKDKVDALLGPDLSNAAFDALQAEEQQTDTTICQAGLTRLADAMYDYPKGPGTKAAGVGRFVKAYREFEGPPLSACDGVGEFLSSYDGEDALAEVRTALGADDGGWAGYFTGPAGIVTLGKQAVAECGTGRSTSFDCEQVPEQVNAAVGRAGLAMALLDSITFGLAAQAVPAEQTAAEKAVEEAEDLATDLAGDTVEVTAAGSDLAGMTITKVDDPALVVDGAKADSLGDLALGLAEDKHVPTIPAAITPLSEVFTAESFSAPVELRFPVPAGVSPFDVSLYTLTATTESPTPEWIPTALGRSYEGTDDAAVLVVGLAGLDGPVFWGRPTAAIGTGGLNRPAFGAPEQVASAAPEGVACKPGAAPANMRYVPAGYSFECTTAIDGVKITILNWGANTNRYGVTKEAMVGYIAEIMAWATEHGVAYHPEITVSIEAMTGKGGFVSYNQTERGRTLHLNNTDSGAGTGDNFKGLVLHEFFHHLQFKPLDDRPDVKTIFDTPAKGFNNWISEGTADWIPDELHDDDDLFLRGNVPSIMSAGLNAGYTGAPHFAENFPYYRAYFWKLVSDRCPGFVDGFAKMLLIDGTQYPLLADAIGGLMAGSWQCDFGAQLGESRKASYTSALAYFQYATQLENRLSLLDANEKDAPTKFKGSTATFAPWPTAIKDWTARPGFSSTIASVTNVRSLAAQSFTVPALSEPVPEGKVAELVIDTKQKLAVSITSKDERFQGFTTMGPDQTQHAWFETPERTSYVYQGGTVPSLFVTLVNPGLAQEDLAQVKVSFRIRDKVAGDDTLLAPPAELDASAIPKEPVIATPEEKPSASAAPTPTATGMGARRQGPLLVYPAVANAGGECTGIPNPSDPSRAMVRLVNPSTDIDLLFSSEKAPFVDGPFVGVPAGYHVDVEAPKNTKLSFIFGHFSAPSRTVTITDAATQCPTLNKLKKVAKEPHQPVMASYADLCEGIGDGDGLTRVRIANGRDVKVKSTLEVWVTLFKADGTLQRERVNSLPGAAAAQLELAPGTLIRLIWPENKNTRYDLLVGPDPSQCERFPFDYTATAK